MSREIKFRAWDCKENSYAKYGVKLKQDGSIVSDEYDWVNEEWYSKVDEEHNFIIEQYTGLKDKNGKEIYEGDIIQCHLSPISSTIFTGVVEFRPGCIMFKNFSDSGAYAFNFLGAIEAVIGNIHENPELLGGEE